MIRVMSVEDFFRLCFGGEPYRHQAKASEELKNGNSVVIRAPCGSGKTEACVFPFLLGRDAVLPQRLIYSLPTRALIEDVADRMTEKLNKLSLDVGISRQHGANSDDPFFKKDLIFTTIDQTVGAYCCTPLSLPVHLGNIPAGAAVSSLLCFDEVHTYDHSLGLKTMLVLLERSRELGLPFVVMSATLPDSFVQNFKEKGIAVIEARDADVPKRRNRVVTLCWTGKLLEIKDILEYIPANGKIMVVCNTVNRAQQLYSELNLSQIPVFLLHSRFLPCDRERIEKKMKRAFKEQKNACLITTQVCEVGLDISCDVMLTELAPPDALVQRMGRCAREGGNGRAYVFDIEYPAPYDRGLVEESKKYIIDKLDGKTVGWDRELEFVNSLLGDEFEAIMNDEAGRRRMLSELGDAAFRGDKGMVESHVRDILSANITIHENPSALSYPEMLRMPWLNVDVRVLQRALKNHNLKMWYIDFGHDERGEHSFDLRHARECYPYDNYVLHPNKVRYDPDKGLIFGEEGCNFYPKEMIKQKDREKYDYRCESWSDHVQRCLTALEQVTTREPRSLKLLSKLTVLDFKMAEGLLAFCVALHDLGKLNREWQEILGIKGEPVAHIPRGKLSRCLPPHAVISGWASQCIFEDFIKSRTLRHSIVLAISHHHHTRSENVPRYELGWRNLVYDLLKGIASKYYLNVNLSKIIWAQERETILRAKFPAIEQPRSYTVYALVSRIIRLCDQESFQVRDEKTKSKSLLRVNDKRIGSDDRTVNDQ